MHIQVNGQSREAPPGTSLRALLNELGVKGDAVVVQRNNEVVARAQLDQVALEEGDVVEVVRLVGGG